MSFIHRFKVFLTFVVLFSSTFDSEILLLSVSAEKTTQKIFRVEIAIEREFVFVAIVFDFLQIISSDKIAISDHNAEKKVQNEQDFFAKKNSNDVERQRFDAFSSSLSFNALKSNDQKNFDSFV